MSELRSSKKFTIVHGLSWCIIIAAFALSSCGGGGGGGAVPPSACTCSSGTAFWAADFTANSLYCVCADQVAVGANSRIFVEQGLAVPGALASLPTDFDTIYTTDILNFGNEPNPGIDGDPLITILLLKIKDGFNGGSYTAGYFDPGNEYPLSAYPYSNQREMFYMNINPALTIDSAAFYSTLAHEFQHMIHWEQKTHQKGLIDDIWLNEAMSEIAPTFLYPGPSCSRIYTYEQDPSNSLTTWNGTVHDYGIAYMWSQYYKDRFGGSIFKSMLTTTSTGITSVNEALAAASTGKTFDTSFFDLSIAILSGTSIWSGFPEWSYTSIDTAPGPCSPSITLTGLFTAAPNVTPLPALGPWSIGFYSYQPTLGTFTWTAPSALQKATFYDVGSSMLYPALVSGATISYSTQGYLVVTNQSNATVTSGGGVVSTAPLATGRAMYLSPKQMLDAANVQSLAEGKPREVCVHSALLEREKELRRKGFKPGF